MFDPRFTTSFIETIDKVLSARTDTKEAVRAAAVVIAMRFGRVSVDDLRDCVTLEGDQRWFGGLLRGLETRGILTKHGYEKTRRKTSHGRDIVVYRLAEDWEKCWPRDQLSPKARITQRDDGEMLFVEERIT